MINVRGGALRFIPGRTRIAGWLCYQSNAGLGVSFSDTRDSDRGRGRTPSLNVVVRSLFKGDLGWYCEQLSLARSSQLHGRQFYSQLGLSHTSYTGRQLMSRELDLKTLELCRADIEQVGRELLGRERPKVARELRDLCSLLRSRVIISREFSDVIEPLDRIVETATLIEQQRKSNDTCYQLRLALQSLAMALVDYRAGVR